MASPPNPRRSRWYAFAFKMSEASIARAVQTGRINSVARREYRNRKETANASSASTAIHGHAERFWGALEQESLALVGPTYAADRGWVSSAGMSFSRRMSCPMWKPGYRTCGVLETFAISKVKHPR